jgi:hypothetical protein
VVFDANEQLIGDLHDRLINAMSVQHPLRMGYESVKAIGMKLKDETPPRYIDSGVTKLLARTLKTGYRATTKARY